MGKYSTSLKLEDTEKLRENLTRKLNNVLGLLKLFFLYIFDTP